MNPNISQVASLIADPSRATILMCLMDGRTLPAGELARMAQITPQTASSHLSKLVEGGLLAMESFGRHRYYRLANREVAQALEALTSISPVQKVRSLRESEQTKKLFFARTCYDHLAGEVGVALTESILELKLLTPDESDYKLTEKGKQFFKDFGIDMESWSKKRRHFARQCLDWSERRHHIAGALGAAIADRFFALGWIQRVPGNRSIQITETGKRGLFETFNLQL